VSAEQEVGRGVVRLLVTSGGRTLCLAGAVDDAAVDGFHRRYGREPAPIERLEAGSVTSLSPAAVALVREHLRAARRAGRPVAVQASGPVAGVLDGDRGGGPHGAR
jgi:hypothetical protein